MQVIDGKGRKDFKCLSNEVNRGLQHDPARVLPVTTQLPPCYDGLVFPAKIQGIIMPKLKTHKGASKRFKKTGTGLVVRNHAFGRHILTSKPHKRKKKLHQSVVADKADQPVLKRMIPY
jgi:large subunit ribosomal protein L35